MSQLTFLSKTQKGHNLIEISLWILSTNDYTDLSNIFHEMSCGWSFSNQTLIVYFRKCTADITLLILVWKLNDGSRWLWIYISWKFCGEISMIWSITKIYLIKCKDARKDILHFNFIFKISIFDKIIAFRWTETFSRWIP